jgi:hypothetical protein
MGCTAGSNVGSEEKCKGAPRVFVSSDENEEAEVVKVKEGFFGAMMDRVEPR